MISLVLIHLWIIIIWVDTTRSRFNKSRLNWGGGGGGINFCVSVRKFDGRF